MKAVYPVYFTSTDLEVLIEVPDLDILTQGKDYNDAIAMARDAIELKCVTLEDKNMAVPAPSDLKKLDMKEGTFYEEGKTIISLVDINSTEYRRKIDTRTVRRNVALPSWLNYEAEKSGLNVSRVLQEALIQVLNLPKDYAK